MTIVLFEDEQVRWLYPITISKPAFAISCGSRRLIDVVAGLGHALRWIVRPHLEVVTEANFTAVPAPFPGTPGEGWSEGLPVANGPLTPTPLPGVPGRGASPRPVLLVNSRMVPSSTVAGRLQALLADGRPGIVRTGESVAAVLLAADSPPPPANGCVEELTTYLAGLDLPALDVQLPLFDYPHDVIRHHVPALRENLAERLASGAYRETADGLFLAEGVKLGQYVVTDSSDGPILIEAGASIGHYCYLSGPAHIGAGARVIEHSAIKDGVALGHTTKIGGEVEASIIEPYTNKQHHGFLGHSYLGSWINLGAGTCNSDLKNTYGQVNMEYHGRKLPTGMQFVGCIMGDYAKTAINTGIFTGKTIGACSMLYGFVTTNVASFVNYARSFGQVTEAPVSVMVATQARMFARRNVVQRPCDIQLLQDMYALTQHERQLAGDPLAF